MSLWNPPIFAEAAAALPPDAPSYPEDPPEVSSEVVPLLLCKEIALIDTRGAELFVDVAVKLLKFQ